VAVTGDAPIQSPFEHGKALVPWERREAGVAVDAEHDLRRDPSAQARGPFDAHAEVRERRSILDGVAGVVKRDAVDDGVQPRANVGDDRARAQTEAGAA